MNSVGIDVSKGKSMVAVLRPFGEIVVSPYEVSHDVKDLRGLVNLIKGLEGETRVVMEYTGTYYTPIAQMLYENGIFVSVVHVILIHGYNQGTIRRVKTDKKDALKIASYGLDRWMDLVRYVPEDGLRSALKSCNRQYDKYSKIKTMFSNNLASLLDRAFPDVNKLFTSPARSKDGHFKWVDFVMSFWHCECVCGLSQRVFKEKYSKWCKRHGYHYRESKAEDIYFEACGNVCALPKCDSTKTLVVRAATLVNAVSETLGALRQEMNRLAKQLPEYPVVMELFGVGEALGPQLMAEIGDVRRFARKQSLVAYAGIDSPPCQSGAFESRIRKISKRGSPFLRKTLFLVMSILLRVRNADDQVYQYLIKKQGEGKHYYVYMMAGSNKFLRIYYARVKEYLDRFEI
jgi:transposase